MQIRLWEWNYFGIVQVNFLFLALSSFFIFQILNLISHFTPRVVALESQVRDEVPDEQFEASCGDERLEVYYTNKRFKTSSGYERLEIYYTKYTCILYICVFPIKSLFVGSPLVNFSEHFTRNEKRWEITSTFLWYFFFTYKVSLTPLPWTIFFSELYVP